MYYILSDPHGYIHAFEQALIHWKPKDETLILLGDYVDKGAHSMPLVKRIMQLKKQYGDKIIVLQGNHDNAFANLFMTTDQNDLHAYYMPSQEATYRSFYEYTKSSTPFDNASHQERLIHIADHCADEIRFLHTLPIYHETANCLFVHAGINIKHDNWRTDTRAMLSIRSPFIYAKQTMPKKIFFGHTATPLIRDEPDNHDIWIHPNNDRVGIDGGITHGGQLNSLRVDAYGTIIETFAAKT